MLASTVAACAPTRPPPSLLAERSAAGLQQMTLDVRSGAKTHRFVVEVARSAQEQETGLMNRPSLGPDRGMIFPYDPPQPVSFWMKDTLIPLSIAFVDEAGRVIDVLDMQPCESDPCPTYGVDDPYVFAIEANLGWFDDHGVGPGDEAELRTGLYG